MYTPVSLQELDKARQDVESLEKVVNGNENEDVTTRLGETYPTLSKFINSSETLVQSSIDAVIDGSMITDELVSVGNGETQADKNAEFELDKFDTGITATPQYVGAVARNQAQVNSENTTAKTFGAKCDGVTDDTIALQKYLDTNITNIVIPDSCLVSNTLTSNLDNRTIKTTGNGIVFASGVSDVEVLNVYGKYNTVTVDIDGGNKACVGVRTYGDNSVILKCNISNLFGLVSSAHGIVVDGDIAATVALNTVTNVEGTRDVTTGNATGACRGVYVVSTVARTKPVLITENTLTGIAGQEGDAIHVIVSNGTYPFLDANAIIENNTIINCTRRAIKVQASRVDCIRNTHKNTLTESQISHPAALISVISSDYVNCTGNVLDAKVAFSGISVSGQVGVVNIGNVIDSNTMEVGYVPTSGLTPAQAGIYSIYNTQMVVHNNIIRGGITAIALDQITASSVCSNKISDGNGSTAITLSSTVTGCEVSDNKMLSGNRGFFIQNTGAKNIVTSNAVLMGTAGCIRVLPTAAGSIYEGNKNLGTGSVIYHTAGQADNQYIGSNRSIQGGSSSGAVMFTSQIPNLEQPASRHNKGDISFNLASSIGGIIGWQCTSGGNPGVWQGFGATP